MPLYRLLDRAIIDHDRLHRSISLSRIVTYLARGRYDRTWIESVREVSKTLFKREKYPRSSYVV